MLLVVLEPTPWICGNIFDLQTEKCHGSVTASRHEDTVRAKQFFDPSQPEAFEPRPWTSSRKLEQPQ